MAPSVARHTLSAIRALTSAFFSSLMTPFSSCAIKAAVKASSTDVGICWSFMMPHGSGIGTMNYRQQVKPTSWVQWACRRGESGVLPPGGWTKQMTVESGYWTGFGAELVEVPASLGLDG